MKTKFILMLLVNIFIFTSEAYSKNYPIINNVSIYYWDPCANLEPGIACIAVAPSFRVKFSARRLGCGNFYIAHVGDVPLDFKALGEVKELSIEIEGPQSIHLLECTPPPDTVEDYDLVIPGSIDAISYRLLNPIGFGL